MACAFKWDARILGFQNSAWSVLCPHDLSTMQKETIRALYRSNVSLASGHLGPFPAQSIFGPGCPCRDDCLSGGEAGSGGMEPGNDSESCEHDAAEALGTGPHNRRSLDNSAVAAAADLRFGALGKAHSSA
jgi:hypothetical protein